MKILAAISFALLFATACADRVATKRLPDGFKVWVMNAEERYVSDSGNELLVGPLLKQVGVTEHYLVATSEAPGLAYSGHVKTSGYSVIERSPRHVSTGMTLLEAELQLARAGESMPEMLDYNQYELVTQ